MKKKGKKVDQSESAERPTEAAHRAMNTLPEKGFGDPARDGKESRRRVAATAGGKEKDVEKQGEIYFPIMNVTERRIGAGTGADGRCNKEKRTTAIGGKSGRND